MKVYKIRNKITGLFSTGGTRPKFNKKGKIWNDAGLLKNHLHKFDHVYIGYDHENKRGIYVDKIPVIYKDCEIIEYDLETSMNVTNVIEVK